MLVGWNQVQPTSDTWDWSQTDTEYSDLLADGLRGKAVEVELTEVVAGSADDGHAGAGLRAWSERGKGTWCARPGQACPTSYTRR